MKPITLLLAIFIVTISSCKKDKDPAETILRAHKWRFEELWQYSKPVVLPDCAKDDLLVFDTASEGYRDYGTQHCVPTTTPREVFRWTLSPEEDRLTFDDGDRYPTTYQVISLDHSELVIENYYPERSRFRYVAH